MENLHNVGSFENPTFGFVEGKKVDEDYEILVAK